MKPLNQHSQAISNGHVSLARNNNYIADSEAGSQSYTEVERINEGFVSETGYYDTIEGNSTQENEGESEILYNSSHIATRELSNIEDSENRSEYFGDQRTPLQVNMETFNGDATLSNRSSNYSTLRTLYSVETADFTLSVNTSPDAGISKTKQPPIVNNSVYQCSPHTSPIHAPPTSAHSVNIDYTHSIKLQHNKAYGVTRSIAELSTVGNDPFSSNNLH